MIPPRRPARCLARLPRLGLGLLALGAFELASPGPRPAWGASSPGGGPAAEGPAAQAAAPRGPRAITLAAVWAGDPGALLLEAARAKERAAQAKVLSKEGAFDAKLKSKVDWEAVGYYRPFGAEVGLDAPTRWRGLRFYGGYRLGRDHPLYKYAKETALGGELLAGAALPLWRGGATDRARTDLAVAALDVELARLQVQDKRVALRYKAAKAHADWVAAAHGLRVAQRLLRLAQRQLDALARKAAMGATSKAKTLDYRLALAERRAKLEAKRGKVAKAAAALAVFLPGGVPPAPARAPMELPKPLLEPVRAQETLRDEMLRRRPDLAALDLLARQLDAEAAWAANELAPAIDVYVEGSQGLGGGDKSLTKPELRLGVALELPLQRRKARGARDAAAAKRAALTRERRWRVAALTQELSGLLASLRADEAALGHAQAAVEAAEAMRRAAQARWEAGAEDLFAVYLREKALGKAWEARIDAWRALRMDWIKLRALVAEDARAAGGLPPAATEAAGAG